LILFNVSLHELFYYMFKYLFFALLELTFWNFIYIPYSTTATTAAQKSSNN